MIGLVFEAYEGTGHELNLALALADHAWDDGTHIFPSVAELAIKTRQSERTVQRQLAAMRRSGWLIPVDHATGGRGRKTIYAINPDWIIAAKQYSADRKRAKKKGVNLSPFRWQPNPPKGCHDSDTDSPGGEGSETNAAPMPRPAPAAASAAGVSEHVSGQGSDSNAKGCQVDTLSGDGKGRHGEHKRVSPQAQKGDKSGGPIRDILNTKSLGTVSNHHEPSNARVRAREEELAKDRVADLQRAYPKRAGRLNWAQARRAIRRLILEEGQTWDSLLEATQRFANCMTATGKTGTPHVMDCATFYGAEDRPWAQEWPLPVSPEEQQRQERESAALRRLMESRAERGVPDFRDPLPGETAAAYETLLFREIYRRQEEAHSARVQERSARELVAQARKEVPP